MAAERDLDLGATDELGDIPLLPGSGSLRRWLSDFVAGIVNEAAPGREHAIMFKGSDGGRLAFVVDHPRLPDLAVVSRAPAADQIGNDPVIPRLVEPKIHNVADFDAVECENHAYGRYKVTVRNRPIHSGPQQPAGPHNTPSRDRSPPHCNH